MGAKDTHEMRHLSKTKQPSQPVESELCQEQHTGISKATTSVFVVNAKRGISHTIEECIYIIKFLEFLNTSKSPSACS